MRIGIITDIHEDFAMLQRAMQALESVGYDMLAILGDITGYSSLFHSHTPDANACLDLIRAQAHVVIPGNHDLFTTQRLPSYHKLKQMPADWYSLPYAQQQSISSNTLWLYEHEEPPALTAPNRVFLEGLQEWQVVDADGLRILLTHFLFPDPLGIGRWFPSHVDELKPHFEVMEELGCQLGFTGHCHPEGVALLTHREWPAPCFDPVRISPAPCIVLCPATVRSAKPSGCVVFDSQKGRVIPTLLAP